MQEALYIKTGKHLQGNHDEKLGLHLVLSTYSFMASHRHRCMHALVALRHTTSLSYSCPPLAGHIP